MNNGQKREVNNGSIIDKLWSILAAVVFDFICVLCFLYSTRIMFEDVYKYGAMGSRFVLRIVAMVIIVSLISEVADRFGKLIGVFTKLGTMIAGALWLLRYLRVEAYLNGFRKIGSLYIADWNEYFGTSIAIGIESSRYVVNSLDLATIVLFFVFLCLSKIIKNNILLGAIPGTLFIAIILVGKMPGIEGVFLLLAGVLLVKSRGFGKIDFKPSGGTTNNLFAWAGGLAWLRCGIIAAVLFFVISNTQDDLARQTVREYSASTKQFATTTVNKTIEYFNRMELSIKDAFISGKWGDIFNLNAGEDSDIAKIDNSTPEYSGEYVLQVTLGKGPMANMYLRDFCAISYKDGIWTRNSSYSSNTYTEKIHELVVNKMKTIYKVNMVSELHIGNHANVEYLKDTKYVSVTFASEIDYPSFDIKVTGDGCFEKDINVKMVVLNMWNWSGKYEDLAFICQADRDYVERWYEQYVQEVYLDVPDGMTYVEKISDEILQKFEYSDKYLELGGENAERLQKAMAVVDWMRTNTVYSLKLPKLPRNTDPVEFFLGTSRIGYCMHYASASTLLLRKMGVPARYASGYIVEASSFTGSTMFTSFVPDNNAHAWVEIYLNGIGWVPVEVTNGYTDEQEDLPGEQTTTSTEPTTEPPETDITTDVGQQTTTYDNETSESESQQGGQDENPSGGQDDLSYDEKSYWPIVFVILGMPVSILAVFFIYFQMPKIRQYIIKRELQRLERKGPRKAIQTINRRIYYKLCMLGKIPVQNIKDDAYEKVLKQRYSNIEETDWERYMEIVKAAVFAKREMTEEEMKFCYEIYRQT